MVGKLASNSWRSLDPMMTKRTCREFEAQAVMIVAEIIEAAHDIHASNKSFGTASQRTCSSYQAVQMHSEGGVEPFDENRC